MLDIYGTKKSICRDLYINWHIVHKKIASKTYSVYKTLFRSCFVFVLFLFFGKPSQREKKVVYNLM